MTRVQRDIARERKRQDSKWGQQNHPNGTGAFGYRERCLTVRQWNEIALADESMDWSLILLEEVYEALAEKSPRKLRTELVQVAAVATAWIECIDRKSKRKGKQ